MNEMVSLIVDGPFETEEQLKAVVLEELSEGDRRALDEALSTGSVRLTRRAPLPNLFDEAPLGQVEYVQIAIEIAVAIVSAGIYDSIKMALGRLVAQSNGRVSVSPPPTGEPKSSPPP